MAGLTIPAYQPAMDGVVNTDPMMPASSETTIAMMSLNVLFIFIVLFLWDKICRFFSSLFLLAEPVHPNKYGHPT
ncbi:MAG: hypothetical protein UU48_C0004G0078 [Candidatus Uhrbacteria bacterium GW2011_GWF2_41_16]|uniref:Uncharacterized protein n=1 Tax=Candidatus Uhrbacteria bacterium GW2011_GWF2_41_16 TaxID=1618997 RepID=A0A0G0XNA5_9BACT|nr:MAG: hypothetical protein UU48_C0004G0078 [Candidatus Uhrbacteria bacterium GW2011_GWF2_41_16]